MGSTRWLNGIPRQWNGFRLEERYKPELRYNKSPKAVFEIVAVDGGQIVRISCIDQRRTSARPATPGRR